MEASNIQNEMMDQVRQFGHRGAAVYEADGITVHFKFGARHTLTVKYLRGQDLYRVSKIEVRSQIKTADLGVIGWPQLQEQVTALKNFQL